MSVLVRAKHTLPELGYDYNSLEPTISAEIMEVFVAHKYIYA